MKQETNTWLTISPLVASQTEKYKEWKIQQIPREENGQADALAKVAATIPI